VTRFEAYIAFGSRHFPRKKPEAFAPESTYNLERVAIQDGYHDKDIL